MTDVRIVNGYNIFPGSKNNYSSKMKA